MQPSLPSRVRNLNWKKGNACIKSRCRTESRLASLVMRIIEMPGAARRKVLYLSNLITRITASQARGKKHIHFPIKDSDWVIINLYVLVGGLEKGRLVCEVGVGKLSTLSTDTAGKLDVLGHDGDTLGMDGTQVGVLKEADEVSLTGLLISRRATVPGLYLCGFLTPPVAGADLRAALVASSFLGPCLQQTYWRFVWYEGKIYRKTTHSQLGGPQQPTGSLQLSGLVIDSQGYISRTSVG